MNKQYPVYTLVNECHDCYKCVRECPVKAIKIESGHASVIPDRCIACGHCVKACPSSAKRVRCDIDLVKNLILAKKDVYVSLAPSWSGVFDFSENKMISVLKKLGFKYVSETALGAQEVSIKTAEMLNESKKGLYISSACPVVVDFIKMYYPEFSKYITPLGSPAMTHAKILKEMYGEDISIVFIGPCIGKKNEVDYKGLFDAALTFEELKMWIQDDAIDVNSIAQEQNSFVPQHAYEGALYPIDGGMNQTIRRIGIKDDVQLINISGIHSLEIALKSMDVEKLEQPFFIEALSCEGGCVGGPCISVKKAGLTMVSEIVSGVKYREHIPVKSEYVVDYEINPVYISEKDYPIEDIMKVLKNIGKHNVDDELNCGGCGYQTCRELANAILSGVAEPSMCVSYMRKIAMRKAAAMLRCMPSAIVMVDNKLNIIETNDAFLKMFTGDMYELFSSRPEGLAGAALDRIVDISGIFKTILSTGKDLHKERYEINGKLYDINAFTIEENEIVGAVITDVTMQETNREQISKKAHEVISKNIAIVQEIACLLGEHMVETETLLSSIANDYDEKGE